MEREEEPGALTPFGPGIWIADGPAVPFFTMPYPLRMSVIRLENGDLFIHSPIQPDDELMNAVAALGRVRHLVSPNKLHHLYMSDWKARFPGALLYASPGLRAKRKDIVFDTALGDEGPAAWAGQIDQRVFRGSFFMEEVVFFHRASRTLILADLIENFPADHFTGWQKWLARMIGIVQPDVGMPRDWRLTVLNRKRARECIAAIAAWKPEKIIVAHGDCIEENAGAALKRAFGWLGS